AIASPFLTSLKRPPDALFREWWRTLGIASAATSTTRAITPSSASVFRPQADQATIPTPTARATKLDCEKEKTSPIQETTIAAEAATTIRLAAPCTTSTRLARIATTRKRP